MQTVKGQGYVCRRTVKQTPFDTHNETPLSYPVDGHNDPRNGRRFRRYDPHTPQLLIPMKTRAELTPEQRAKYARTLAAIDRMKVAPTPKPEPILTPEEEHEQERRWMEWERANDPTVTNY